MLARGIVSPSCSLPARPPCSASPALPCSALPALLCQPACSAVPVCFHACRAGSISLACHAGACGPPPQQGIPVVLLEEVEEVLGIRLDIEEVENAMPAFTPDVGASAAGVGSGEGRLRCLSGLSGLSGAGGRAAQAQLWRWRLRSQVHTRRPPAGRLQVRGQLPPQPCTTWRYTALSLRNTAPRALIPACLLHPVAATPGLCSRCALCSSSLPGCPALAPARR